MALYRATIRKDLPAREEKWSNVYHVVAADIDGAAQIARNIATIEQSIHYVAVHFASFTVMGATGTGTGLEESLDFNGLRQNPALGAAAFLPLWNVALVKFRPAQGRMSPKYLRLPLAEEDVDGGNLVGTLVTLINGQYAGPLLGLAGVVDEDGQPMLTFLTQTAIQMRQMGWHRRTRPGFKRGWVPV